MWGAEGAEGARPADSGWVRIDARNHAGDNGRRVYRRLIHTLLPSPSHNHTIRGEEVRRGRGVTRDGVGEGVHM